MEIAYIMVKYFHLAIPQALIDLFQIKASKLQACIKLKATAKLFLY